MNSLINLCNPLNNQANNPVNPELTEDLTNLLNPNLELEDISLINNNNNKLTNMEELLM